MSVHLHTVGSSLSLSQTKKNQTAEVGSKSSSDKSPASQDKGGTSLRLSTFAESVAAAPVVDQARVERVAGAIQSGRYEIDPQKVAEKIIEQELGLP